MPSVVINVPGKGLHVISGVVFDEGTDDERTAVFTQRLDPNGVAEGETGYIGPVVQQTTLKIVTGDIVYADLASDIYTFPLEVDAVAIINDGTANLTITLDDKTFTIKAGESRIIEPENDFRAVTFSALATFRMNGLWRS